jgi:miniconductance mechanosensitive channel
MDTMKIMTEYTFAEKLRETLLHMGLSDKISGYIVDFSVLFIIFLSSVMVYYILKFILNRFIKKLIDRSVSKWDDYLHEEKVFTRIALLIPALIIQFFLNSAVTSHPHAIHMIEVVLRLYMIAIVILVIISFLNAVYRIYGEFEVAVSRPIKGYIQILKIIVFIFSGIVIISTLVGQSPITILAGLGAISAVLLLIFRDSLLGFVAGIQLSSNKMVHIGDWITFAKYNADGIVIDISLVTVKVRNWDNSVSLIPTYFMVADSFLNWRSMAESGGRRLKRSLNIDVRTVKEASQEMFDRTNDLVHVDNSMFPHGKITNLGIFRIYLMDYLKKCPEINTGMDILVRLQQGTDLGLPMEIIAYTRFPDLAAFESFQSGLFEHIYSVLPLFELAPYQRP